MLTLVNLYVLSTIITNIKRVAVDCEIVKRIYVFIFFINNFIIKTIKYKDINTPAAVDQSAAN